VVLSSRPRNLVNPTTSHRSRKRGLGRECDLLPSPDDRVEHRLSSQLVGVQWAPSFAAPGFECPGAPSRARQTVLLECDAAHARRVLVGEVGVHYVEVITYYRCGRALDFIGGNAR